MMSNDSVIVVIEYRALPGQVDVARRELAGIVATVIATEPDCSGIEILQNTDDGAHFLLYERWSSREAFTGPHMQTPHLQEFMAKAPEFIASPPGLTFLKAVG